MGRLNYRYQKEEEPLAASSGSTLLFERRVLTFVTALLGLGLVSWLTAISTDYWVVVVAGYNGTIVGNKTFLWSHSGLWRQCDIFAFLENETSPHISRCRQGIAIARGSFPLFLDKEALTLPITYCLFLSSFHLSQ